MVRLRASKVKDVGRLLDPAPRIEELDLLLAEPVDIERAPRGEMLEVLRRLVRASQLPAAAADGAFRSRRCRLAHHCGPQGTRACCQSDRAWSCAGAFPDDAKHLRDDVAGTLDPHRVADVHVEARDLVGIVQGGVLHHHAAY
jgi:hypothetical protein